MSVPIPERLLHLIERLLQRRCVLRLPSQFLDECDLVGDTPFEVGNIVGEPSQFLLLIESSAVRPEGVAEQVFFKLEHTSA